MALTPWGFIDATFKSLLHPGRNMRAFGRRLAQRFVAHWWKHATRDELMDAKVYETVRSSLSRALKPRMKALIAGVALRRPMLMPFYVRAGGSTQAVWS